MMTTTALAIINAFQLLPASADGYHNIGVVAWLAAQQMGGNPRRQLREIETCLLNERLPFEFSTHIHHALFFYADTCGRRRWPASKGYLKDGLPSLGRRGAKVMKLVS